MGHMEQFRKERDDWQSVLDAMQKVRLKTCTFDLGDAIVTAAKYAIREYPIYQMHPFPTSFQAVDTFVNWREAGKVLLGQKKGSKLWQFPGGFMDPKDGSLEDGAVRERVEEVGIDMECSRPEYLFSYRVSDPRYANSPDKIMTAVFQVYYLWGAPKGKDDLPTVKWFTKDYLRRRYSEFVAPLHHRLVELLIQTGRL